MRFFELPIRAAQAMVRLATGHHPPCNARPSFRLSAYSQAITRVSSRAWRPRQPPGAKPPASPPLPVAHRPTPRRRQRAQEGDDTRHLVLAPGYVPVMPPKSQRRNPWDWDPSR